ncbi:phosphonate metabolism protein/1,5-bisphosphokinase (PRPP-forming) PhnN [Sediminicurvatus halobius]|uniref:ribose 1,5-bisphosphate phosphokinase n=1 Tax=Sediminicurvatus halobius TaxID=2182432 RepID=A0A2U2MWH6_9GAMM|nr:phosphonate metabolism protein/1,5-bisphosphokinase (PRPP-forming) PhnN [Spiribacter halobius]PWG61211.1 phosphonate metabolism protein/1,5-bisphosphokinase (PRPP-forming) PhnN [Spiribacter halobius]UEX77949.1 phosphonate metabolism protein/1,5-bisphosphokinase (PRPP-forming) PhnN [Spiribacter halobius]
MNASPGNPASSAVPLFYLVGPSGVGKDSVIKVLQTLVQGGELFLPRRVITRPVNAGGEQHEAVPESEFAAREAAGEFLFAWRSHGRCYGIGLEAARALAAGTPVLVNGSREYLPQARARVPALVPLALHAPPDVLRDRLLGRAREDEDEVRARLARAAALQSSLPADTRFIAAEGPVEGVARRVLDLVRNGNPDQGR